MTQQRTIVLEDWPVAPVRQETNRERILRALREADGVVPQCYGEPERGDARCAGKVVGDVGPGMSFYSQGIAALGEIVRLNDRRRMSFAQIADYIADRPEFWNSHADEPFTVSAGTSEGEGG